MTTKEVERQLTDGAEGVLGRRLTSRERRLIKHATPYVARGAGASGDAVKALAEMAICVESDFTEGSRRQYAQSKKRARQAVRDLQKMLREIESKGEQCK